MREVVDKIAIIDFGGQYNHLISRRVREPKVYCEIIRFDSISENLEALNSFRRIIFSGGPSSVYDENAPLVDERVYSLGLPILGICYGHQMIALQLGGEVVRGEVKEYGKTRLFIEDEDDIFDGVKRETIVWMSHGDMVLKLPKGFKGLART